MWLLHFKSSAQNFETNVGRTPSRDLDGGITGGKFNKYLKEAAINHYFSSFLNQQTRFFLSGSNGHVYTLRQVNNHTNCRL